MEPLEDPILLSRLDAITDAQKRARIALFACVLASGALIGGLWNEYFGWDRKWADATEMPKAWGQRMVQEATIRYWVESNTVGVSPLGIRFMISDVAVLGTLVLLVFSFYHCICLRRENQEIGSLLVATKDSEKEVKRLVMYRIRASMVLTTTSAEHVRYDSLTDRTPVHQKLPLARFVHALLNYLPAITMPLIVLSDLYYATLGFSAWSQDAGAAWAGLGNKYRLQLITTDIFAIAVGLLIFVYCKHAAAFQRGTRHILEEFAVPEEQMRTGETQQTGPNETG